MVRSLITGASGFAGRALLEHLTDSGDEVVSWSRATGDPDITDRKAVAEAIETAAVDVIYHLAAQSHVPTAWSDPVSTLRINVEGTQNVLDAALTANRPRVLVVTSAEVYGAVEPEHLPITEHTPLRPSNPYAASKAAADAIALAAHLGRDLDVVRLRSFNHFGPGQDPSFVSPGFARRIAIAARDGHSSIEVGALDVRRDFCDVRDVVRAYRLAAIDGVSGEVYNVCSGADRPIRDIADAFVERSGADIAFVQSPDFLRNVDSPVVRGSAERLAEHTGWAPAIPFDQTIDDIYAEALRNLDSGSSK